MQEKRTKDALTSAVMALKASDSAEFPGKEEGRLKSERRDGVSEASRGFSVSLAALRIAECDLRVLSGTLMPSMLYSSSCARSRALLSDVGVTENCSGVRRA